LAARDCSVYEAYQITNGITAAGHAISIYIDGLVWDASVSGDVGQETCGWLHVVRHGWYFSIKPLGLQWLRVKLGVRSDSNALLMPRDRAVCSCDARSTTWSKWNWARRCYCKDHALSTTSVSITTQIWDLL